MHPCLILSPSYRWSIRAEPDCAHLLTILQDHLLLSSCTRADPGSIRLVPVSGDEPVRAQSWREINGHFGFMAADTGTRNIELGMRGAAVKHPFSRSWLVKSLMVGICTLLLPSGGLLLHGATLVHHGQAYLILASSGGGKSTSTRRIPPSWEAPGDELALVLPSSQGAYEVHVLPTASAIGSGCSIRWDISRSIPLRGIGILIQDDQDRLVPCSRGEAAGYLTGSARQAIRNQEIGMNSEYKRWNYEMFFTNACILSGIVPVFLLHSSMTGRFWELLENFQSHEPKMQSRC